MIQKNNRIDELENELRQSLTFGPWKLNEKLPPEETFMERFKVSRSMLREAMKTLSAEGIIVRKHGSGTYLQYIPKKRLELFVRLDNIVSPAANWYRWQIEQLKKICRSMDWELEVLVSCGDTQSEMAVSFHRHISRPKTSELVGSILLFYCAELEERLLRRGARFVTVTTVCRSPMRGAAVILDYLAMGRILAEQVVAAEVRCPFLFYVDDPESLTGPEQHREMCELYQLIMPDHARHVRFSAIEAAEREFLAWLAHDANSCDALIFTDDEVAVRMIATARRHGFDLDGMRIFSHGRPGLRWEVETPPVVVGFDPETVTRAAWTLLLDANERRQVRIEPVMMETLDGRSVE